MFKVKCSRCDGPLTDEEGYTTYDEALRAISQHGYRVLGHKLYCDQCEPQCSVERPPQQVW